jgi:hypothetical protein
METMEALKEPVMSIMCAIPKNSPAPAYITTVKLHITVLPSTYPVVANNKLFTSRNTNFIRGIS